jgi:hypothetical protein
MQQSSRLSPSQALRDTNLPLCDSYRMEIGAHVIAALAGNSQTVALCRLLQKQWFANCVKLLPGNFLCFIYSTSVLIRKVVSEVSCIILSISMKVSVQDISESPRMKFCYHTFHYSPIYTVKSNFYDDNKSEMLSRSESCTQFGPFALWMISFICG